MGLFSIRGAYRLKHQPLSQRFVVGFEYMSRTATGSLRFLAFLAASVPLLGFGYIAGHKGMLKNLRFQIELAASSKGMDYERQLPLPGSRSLTAKPLPETVDHLFAGHKKGPRIDQWLIAQSSTSVSKRPRQVVAAISPYKSTLSNAPLKTRVGRHLVNRANKRDRLRIPETRMAKLRVPVHTGAIAKEHRTTQTAHRFERKVPEHRYNYYPPLGRQISAAVFFELPGRAWAYEFTPLTEVDRSNVRPASLGKNRAGMLRNKRRFSGKKNLYYGAMLSARSRQRERNCLAKAIYFESRGEPVHGQLAVAQVVMNRVREKYYPSTVCNVVFEGAHRRNKCQFSFACDGYPDIPRNKRLWRLANQLASKTMNGEVWLKDIGYASHYHATYVRPRWIRYMRRIKRVGVHIFYRGTFLPKVIVSRRDRRKKS